MKYVYGRDGTSGGEVASETTIAAAAIVTKTDAVAAAARSTKVSLLQIEPQSKVDEDKVYRYLTHHWPDSPLSTSDAETQHEDDLDHEFGVTRDRLSIEAEGDGEASVDAVIKRVDSNEFMQDDEQAEVDPEVVPMLHQHEQERNRPAKGADNSPRAAAEKFFNDVRDAHSFSAKELVTQISVQSESEQSFEVLRDLVENENKDLSLRGVAFADANKAAANEDDQNSAQHRKNLVDQRHIILAEMV